MSIPTLFGAVGLAAWPTILSGVLATALFLILIFSILYNRYIYSHILRRGFDSSYEPGCAIIVPCKGTPKGLEENIRAFCRVEYPKYELVLAVESNDDPAVPVLQKAIEGYDNASIVVAGYTKGCAQKNYNLLAALKKTNNPEVYVFADADIRPSGEWLRELLVPLSDPKLSATTGFRWLKAEKHGLGHYQHANVNAFFLTLFGFVSLFRMGSILWGGSMAIRRKDFEEFGIAEKWSRTAVDDFSMSQVLARSGCRSILVPPCITPTDDSIGTVSGTIRWVSRQIMFLKAYHRVLWIFGLGSLWFVAMILYLLLPASIVLSLFSERSFLQLGGGASLLFIGADMISSLLYRFFGPIKGYALYPFLQPFFRIGQLISFGKTLFARSILWSGIRYTLTFSGDVSKVERL